MVEANVKWLNGIQTLVYADNYPHLFELLKNEEISDVLARLVDVDEIKQGKEKGRRKKRG